MRIRSVELTLAGGLVTNDEIVERIAHHSRGYFGGNLRGLTRLVLRLLRGAGAETRYWSRGKAVPIDYIDEAVSRAIAKSGLVKSEIDLVVFAGVDKGFHEPANAYFVADYLGLNSAQCFDVADACNGWSRALQLCHGLFKTSDLRNALIINAEFPMFEGGPVYPRLFCLERLEQLRHRFPGYTLGEGAAATIVTAEDDPNWEYRTISRPSFADLCSVTCSAGTRFSKQSKRLNLNGPGQFVSFGKDLAQEGLAHAVSVLKSLSLPLDSVSAIFPHTVSQPAILAVASAAGASQLVYSVFPKVGNLISASIPAGLCLALKDGRVSEGDIAAGCVASAGMAYSAYTFTV